MQVVPAIHGRIVHLRSLRDPPLLVEGEASRADLALTHAGRCGRIIQGQPSQLLLHPGQPPQMRNLLKQLCSSENAAEELLQGPCRCSR